MKSAALLGFGCGAQITKLWAELWRAYFVYRTGFS
jgi:hypothetical protein